MLRNPAVWMLGIIYFCIQSGVYAINFWLPSIIKDSGFADPSTIGWLSAIPYLAASFFMIATGRSADARRERRWHLGVPMLMGVGGLLIAANFAANPAIALFGLTLATMGAFTGAADVLAADRRLPERGRRRRRSGPDQLDRAVRGLPEPAIWSAGSRTRPRAPISRSTSWRASCCSA